MPLRTPDNREEVIDRMHSDAQAVLANSNPFLRESLLSSLLTAAGGRNFEYYFQLQNLIFDLFPLTATGEFADGWAALKGIFRNPAAAANGNIIVTGVLATSIPIGTTFATPDGRQYNTTLATSVISISNLISISSVGITATATSIGAHGFASGQSITVVGANEAEYNGVFVITRLDDVTFSYDVALGAVSPATGIITATADMATIPSVSVDFGDVQNIAANTQLSITSPIAGLDNTAFAAFPGITGGTDLESDVDFRVRYLEAYQNPIALFNVAQVTAVAKSVPGVTRVFVLQTTPFVGRAEIFFTRDNDSNPIPDANEVLQVDNAIRAIAPVNSVPGNTVVAAPTPITVDFVFTTIEPNTVTMRESITANLQLLFSERTNVSQDLTPDDYRCAIAGTVDNVTGELLTRFVLSLPFGTITVGAGELPVLGGVTFI